MPTNPSGSSQPEGQNYWGRKLLAGVKKRRKLKKTSPGQISLWDEWDGAEDEIREVARKFVVANAANPEIAGARFDKENHGSTEEGLARCQVSDREKVDSVVQTEPEIKL